MNSIQIDDSLVVVHAKSQLLLSVSHNALIHQVESSICHHVDTSVKHFKILRPGHEVLFFACAFDTYLGFGEAC